MSDDGQPLVLPQPSPTAWLEPEDLAAVAEATSEAVAARDAAHPRGECKPCAYFMHKTDGCRWGKDCAFCHLCDRDALKRQKKAKKVRVKEAQAAAMGADRAPAGDAEAVAAALHPLQVSRDWWNLPHTWLDDLLDDRLEEELGLDIFGEHAQLKAAPLALAPPPGLSMEDGPYPLNRGPLHNGCLPANSENINGLAAVNGASAAVATPPSAAANASVQSGAGFVPASSPDLWATQAALCAGRWPAERIKARWEKGHMANAKMTQVEEMFPMLLSPYAQWAAPAHSPYAHAYAPYAHA